MSQEEESESNLKMLTAEPLPENDDEEGDGDYNPLHDTLRYVVNFPVNFAVNFVNLPVHFLRKNFSATPKLTRTKMNPKHQKFLSSRANTKRLVFRSLKSR